MNTIPLPSITHVTNGDLATTVSLDDVVSAFDGFTEELNDVAEDFPKKYESALKKAVTELVDSRLAAIFCDAGVR